MLYLKKMFDSQLAPEAIDKFAEGMTIEDTGEGKDTPKWKDIKRGRGYKNRETGGTSGHQLVNQVETNRKRHNLFINLLGRGPHGVSNFEKENMTQYHNEIKNDPTRRLQLNEFEEKARANGWKLKK